MTRDIYALFYYDPQLPRKKHYFYVGRSFDVIRRMQQHEYSKRKGHEDKYQFIRDLEVRKVKWKHEILHSVLEGEYPPDNERWYVIKLTRNGHTLMNMRYGSVEKRKEISEQIKSPHIRSINDVKVARLKQKYAASRKVKKRIILNTLKTKGIPDLKKDRVLPPRLRSRLISNGVGSVQVGVPISDLILLCRNHIR